MATPSRDRHGAPADAAAIGGEELAEALGRLFTSAREHVERVVEPYGVPPHCAKALTLIDGSMSMKELGSRISCDGSFVTAIADTLEERGLARREIDARDRRIKNLVLTDSGVELGARLKHEIFDDFPGLANLAAAERETLVALLRKMVPAEPRQAGIGPDCAA